MSFTAPVRFTALKSHSRHLAFARFPHYENAVSQALGYTLGQTLVVGAKTSSFPTVSQFS